VSWDEINAALGHTVLLLERLAAHSRVRLSRGKRLMPCGSASKLCVGSEVLELCGSAAQGVDLRRFNAALTAWLECVAETAAHDARRGCNGEWGSDDKTASTISVANYA